MNNITSPHSSWKESISSQLTARAFDQLLAGSLAYIRIEHFAAARECDALLVAAVSEGLSPYHGVDPSINRLGNTVFEYNDISKQEYFRSTIQLRQVQQRIFEQSFNPLERCLELLEQRTQRPAEVAHNLAGQPYYAGLVRRIEQGTRLHVDFAPGEQPNWDIAEVRAQLAWNLYLRVSSSLGARTHIYDRQWQSAFDRFKEGIYGYSDRVVAGAEDAIFTPRAGEVVIFNTRNFHFVEAAVGERVSFTSAIGLLPSGKLVLWS